MRLRDIQATLAEHLPNLRLHLSDLPTGHSDIKGLSMTLAAAHAFSEVPTLNERAERVAGLGIFEEDSSLAVTAQAHQARQFVEQLREQASVLKAFVDAILPPTSGDYFAIKLPLKDGTFDEANTQIARLKVALEQPILRLGNRDAPTTILDVGSTWVEFSGIAPRVLAAVGGLISLAIASVKLEEKRIDLQTKRTGLEKAKQETLQSREATKQAIEVTRQEELKTEQARIELEEKQLERDEKLEERRRSINEQQTDLRIEEFVTSLPDSNEVGNLLRAAVSELAKLYTDGAEFRLSRSAPDEAVAAFPPEARPLVARSTRLLGGGRGDGSTS